MLHAAGPTCSQSTRCHPYMASPVLDAMFIQYQSLGVTPSTQRTYQAGVRSYLQFCYSYNIVPFPTSPLTLRCFCSYIAQCISHKTIKVYLSGIRLEHLEHGHTDPTNDPLLHLLCKGIKRCQGDTSGKRLPITINILKMLKTQLHDSSTHSIIEKQLLWSASTLAFFGFLRASELTSNSLLWSDVQLTPSTITLLFKQSKTDLLGCGQSITLQATSTSTCPVKAMNLFARESIEKSRPVYCGGRFNSLSREQLIHQLHNLLQNAGYEHHLYASHSFRIGAATTAAAAGLPAWLIKAMGRWSSDAYQTYICCPTSVLQSIPQLLAQTDAAQQPPQQLSH